MASPNPTRPFESLDWYRNARHQLPQSSLSYWLRGIGFLSAHISLFALGITALFVVNLLRNPGNLWIDQVIWIWAFLLVVHLVVIGGLFFLGQLGDENDEALEILPPRAGKGLATWPRWPARSEDVRDVDFRVTSPTVEAAETATVPPPKPPTGQASIWQDWPTESAPSTVANDAKPTWQEATTWLSRRRTKSGETETTSGQDGEPRA